MKSVMLSINPIWCELIASGRKTIEVRKTRPKLETPFKCYIYCTQARIPIKDSGRILMYEDDLALTNRWDQGKLVENPCGAMMEGEFFLNGKVIGEFVCDYILEITPDTYRQREYFISDDDLNASCLTTNDLWEYGSGKTLYGWHISDLVIYDEPRELSEFLRINRECWYADLGLAKRDCPECKNAECFVSRPPQSWCYVEEVGE